MMRMILLLLLATVVTQSTQSNGMQTTSSASPLLSVLPSSSSSSAAPGPLVPVPRILSIASAQCSSYAGDGNLYNCTTSLILTMIGVDLCNPLIFPVPYLGGCEFAVGNVWTFQMQVLSFNSSVLVMTHLQPALVFVSMYAPYHLSLWWDKTIFPPTSLVGVNFLRPPVILGVSGCAVDNVEAVTGAGNTTGCQNAVSVVNVTVDLNVGRPLVPGTSINISVTTQLAYDLGPSSIVSVTPTSPAWVLLPLPFIGWTTVDTTPWLYLRFSSGTMMPYPLRSLYVPASLNYSGMSAAPVVTALLTADCVTQSNGNLTACGPNPTYTIIGTNLLIGYTYILNSTASLGSQLCTWQSNTRAVCSFLTTTGQLLTSSPYQLTVYRGLRNFSTPFTVALVGPLVITSITGCSSLTPPLTNLSVTNCGPGDVLTIIGSGWAPTVATIPFAIVGLTIINVALVGSVDANTLAVQLSLPSWYDSRYLPDTPYSLMLSLYNRSLTTPQVITFAYPPPPQIFSVSGCSVQINNGTSNCSVPSPGSPLVLTITGANLYYDNVFLYVGGIYCPGQYFYNLAHYATGTLQCSLYQANFVTGQWVNLAMTLASTPFNTVVLEDAVFFTAVNPVPDSNSSSAIGLSANYLWLLLLLLVPILLVVLLALYLRHVHSNPYLAALTALAKLRTARMKKAVADHGNEGSCEMADNVAVEPSLYQAPARYAGEQRNADIESHSGNGAGELPVSDVKMMDAEYESSSRVGAASPRTV